MPANFKRRASPIAGILAIAFALLATAPAWGQSYAQPNASLPDGLHGDFQWDFAAYRKDSTIGAPEVPERIGSNAYLNLLYDKGPFSGRRPHGELPAASAGF